MTAPPEPRVPGPAAFGSAGSRAPADVWWRELGDPALESLLEEALDANLGVARAAARIAQADALWRQARVAGLPFLDAGAELEDRRGEDPDEGSEWAAGVLLAWELDLFGRLRAAARARDEERAAAAAELQDVRLLLSAQVADTWYQAVEQQLQLALLAEQRELASTLVELTELRFLQGDASAVDVLQQRSQLAAVEAEVPVASALLRLFENRLDVLVGTAADGAARTAEPSASLPAPEDVPVLGVPSELLVRRPDLRALGHRVVAADARIAEALADRLPRVTLTGSLLEADTGLATGWVGTAAASLVQPLLDWGSRRAAVDGARAVHRELWLAFSEAYLVALEEVETTLWRETQQRLLLETLARRVELLENTVQGTRSRYVQGITDYLPVLTAVQELQESQRELLTQRRVLVSLRIQLHRAVGGALPAAATVRRAPADAGAPAVAGLAP